MLIWLEDSICVPLISNVPFSWAILILRLDIAYFDEHLGAVHSKRLLKYPFSVFFGRFLQEFNVKKMNSESLFPNAGWQINAGLAP